MSELPPDDRLISGAVIAAEMWFSIDELTRVWSFGRNAVAEPGAVALWYAVTPVVDVTLEGPVKALSQLTGTLSIGSQRERTGRLGLFSRDTEGYGVGINLFEAELDRFLSLMASGLRPSRLKLEFDIEVAQWFDRGEYWDDVRYPHVELHEYRIDWSR